MGIKPEDLPYPQPWTRDQPRRGSRQSPPWPTTRRRAAGNGFLPVRWRKYGPLSAALSGAGWKGAFFVAVSGCLRMALAPSSSFAPGSGGRVRVALGVLAFLWLVSAPLGCLFGPYPLEPGAVLRALRAFFAGTGTEEVPVLVVGGIRLARVTLALLCGGALAVAGVALQGVLRNPLADPFTLGISAGAACGASLAIAAGGGVATALGLTHTALVAGTAMAGAFLALGLALWLGHAGGAFSRETVILAGIAVAAFLGALVALVKALNEESVTSIVFWILGSFQGRGWESLPLLLAALVPGLLCVGLGWRRLDVLALGGEEAGHLGLAVGRARFWLLAGASCMTAGCVAVAGVIGFVGLVVPHVLRLLMGPAHGPLLAGAFLGGGVLLLWADVAARCVLDGGRELPVGVVTALLGGPFFALLVRRR